MIKLETHCHQKGTSVCADTENRVILDLYKKAGYKAIVSTNHISNGSYAYIKGDTEKEKLDTFFKVYDNFVLDGEKQGIKVFFGAEIRVFTGRKVGTEYCVYGLDRRVFYDNKPLQEFTQEELFRLAEKEHAFMYQTHPFREAVYVGDPQFMHGAESFNGHYHHRNNNVLAEKFCKDYGLIRMSGTDFHHPDQPITAGMYVPESINNECALIEYLFKNDFERIEEHQTYECACDEYKKRKK